MRLLLLAAFTIPAAAQWTIQTPATTADLRGIDNVGKGIAWASGTGGTVLRTEDNGYLWQRCTTPPAPSTWTSAASRPSTPTPPSSCPAAKAT